MSSYSNEKENHVVETLTPQIDDNNDTLLAMVLGANLVFPAVLNAAIELNLFEIIAKETSLDNGKFISCFEIASKLLTLHSDLPNRLDRMLRLLASYSLLSISTRTNDDDDSSMRVYGLTPSGIENVGGTMFESVPQGDAIMLKFICHNWSDEKCLEILSNCHKALPPNGKVILVEFLFPEDLGSTNNASKIISAIDNIMFITAGGKERSPKEYEILGQKSGFSKLQVICRAFSILGVMELYK